MTERPIEDMRLPIQASPRCALIRLAVSYHLTFPGVVVLVCEPWRREYILKLAKRLGKFVTARNRISATPNSERGVRLVEVGRTELVRSALGIFIDPEVVRYDRDREFWETIDGRLNRIAQICRKVPDAAVSR
jgi:hypothetical protein